jgi:hypothetical protein
MDEIMSQQPIPVTKFNLNTLEEYQVALRTKFAEYTILNPEDAKMLEDKVIYGVSLFYTRYSSVEGFNQRDLNKNRIQELQGMYPKAFEETVNWTLLEHIDCNSRTQGQTLFHGFVITYRPHPDSMLAKKEMESIRKQVIGETRTVKDTLNKRVIPLKIENSYDLIQMMTNKLPCCYKDTVTKLINFRLDYVGYPKEVKILNTDHTLCDKQVIEAVKSLPQWNVGIRQGYEAEKFYEIPMFFDCEKDDIVVTNFYANDPADRIDLKKVDESRLRLKSELIRDTFEDHTLFNVFKRNPSWTNMTVICDVTGSMAKYTSQFLFWLRQNVDNGKVKRVVFFNDGDQKDNKSKVVGYTGGIYIANASSFENVFDKCMEAMENGQGGDIPENDIEAIMEATSKYPEVDTVILIADNYATPRDLAIIKDVRVPVRVILCGNEHGGTNTTYLDLAKTTNGSFHTSKDDFIKFPQIELGDKIKIFNKKYKFNGVKFVRTPFEN